MNEQELAQFVEWLPASVDEFREKKPEEIVTILNKLAQTEEGMDMISGLITQFKQTAMFRSGGKISNLINKFQQGGKNKQRNSDKVRGDFHDVSLFDYGPSKYRTTRGISIHRDLKPGTNRQILPNGVGLRQITIQNTTTSELVSPDKRDTLYINNAGAGRVDSNINDAGVLGVLGLKSPSPVSSNFRRLQNIFGTQKFLEGGETLPASEIKRDTTSVDSTVRPAGDSYIDRRMQIVSTFPRGHQEVIDIERSINPLLRDTTFWRTINKYLPNGNIINRGTPNIFTPDQKVKNKLK